MKKLLTLVIIQQENHVLLGMKKRGFGVGRWNGFGGKVNENESIEEAAQRELKEEAGIELGDDGEEVGVLEFEYHGDPDILQVHIFRVTQFAGEPMETEEMRPQWFDANEIPFDLMWPDDKHWFPLLLARKKFTGKFLFGKNDVILKYELKETEAL